MRIALALVCAASLFVAAGCCGPECEAPAPSCDPCVAAAPAPAPVAVVNCDPCKGL